VLPFLHPAALFTTNYDNLAELGWEAHANTPGLKRLSLRFAADESVNPNRIPLFKPHGTVDEYGKPVVEGGFVLTQFDYFRMLKQHQKMLDIFMHGFRQRCVLFVGYSFFDYDIASHLYEMRQKSKGIEWYTVFPRDDNNVRNMYYREFGIHQINRTFHDFLVDLNAAVCDAGNELIPAKWSAERIPDCCGLIEVDTEISVVSWGEEVSPHGSETEAVYSRVQTRRGVLDHRPRRRCQ
jgi:hypothetical protein